MHEDTELLFGKASARTPAHISDGAEKTNRSLKWCFGSAFADPGPFGSLRVLNREDADACRVHPAQRLFPPHAQILADLRHPSQTRQPHLPRLCHVGEP